MPRVTFITPSGEEIEVADAEDNLMTAAVENQVDGINGDCGGVGSCGTCHVVIDAAWADRVGPPSETEQDMLELEDDATAHSRLGCQVELSDSLEGLVVRVVGR